MGHFFTIAEGVMILTSLKNMESEKLVDLMDLVVLNTTEAQEPLGDTDHVS